jgi:hypothetical protein
MKLFNSFAEPGYHTSIVSTFAVDFDAYESIALPRLREAGCNNNLLLADSRMLVQAMDDAFRRPRYAGRRYSVIGVQPTGVFHSKIILQLGKSSGRLLVGSANMTAAGLAGNLEIIGEVKTGEADWQAASILKAAFEYVARFLPASSVPKRQLEWALKRSPWLANEGAGDSLVDLEEGGRLSFLATDSERGIGARFVDLVGKRPVKRLVAMSPYWDQRLTALRELGQQLAPKKTAVLVQAKSALFPVQHWKGGAGLDLYDANQIKGAAASRFAHAKVFIAETDSADCVLFGSANCSQAALGRRNPVSNEEACLYRELEPGHAVRLLGLSPALTKSAVIEASALPAYAPSDAIPMESLQDRAPGRFELNEQHLRWWPPKDIDSMNAEVMLFDHAGRRLKAALTRQGSGTDPVSFRCEMDDIPHFAAIRVGEFESSLAIIIIEQAIGQAQRRSTNSAIDNALAFLSNDDDATEGLWLLDVIQRIHAAEQEMEARPVDAIPHRMKSRESNESASRKLTYEQFIAGRSAVNAAGGRAGSHLASSHQDSVRGFLNALVGRGRISEVDEESDEDQPANRWSMGDDTSEGEHALEKDERFQSDAQLARARVAEDKRRLRRQHQYLKDTQRSIVNAVERFIASMKTEAQERSLGVVDLLRLRAMLMIILYAGSKKTNLLPAVPGATMSKREILPSSGEASWKRLIGRLLYAFFRDRDNSGWPLIDKVVLEVDDDDSLPEDVLECWATCYWSLCATRVFINDKGNATPASWYEQRLARSLYGQTRLLPDELSGTAVEAIFDGMSTRYGERLGVDAKVVRSEHLQLIANARP